MTDKLVCIIDEDGITYHDIQEYCGVAPDAVRAFLVNARYGEGCIFGRAAIFPVRFPFEDISP